MVINNSNLNELIIKWPHTLYSIDYTNLNKELKCCDAPYVSYQKGSNEHLNGIIRRFYKKGFDFSTITDSNINDMQNQINHMSREIFNWKSSYDLYEYENKI